MLKYFPRAVRIWLYGTALFSLAIGINVVQLLSMLIIPFSKRLVWKINSRSAHSMWWVMQWIFERQHKGKITFSGDKIPSNESAAVSLLLSEDLSLLLLLMSGS
ncbi:293_t:CDS:2, partial [Entrophospora sp. SA101]